MPSKRKAESSRSDSSKKSNIEIVEEEPVLLVNEAPIRSSPNSNSGKKSKRHIVEEDDEVESRFIGEPVANAEARLRWPHRYHDKKKAKEIAGSKANEETKDKIQARKHFTHAEVDGHIYFHLGDEAYVKAGEGQDNYICRIVEMFEGVDGSPYVTAQWFYRAKDTVIQACSNLIDDKRVFLSTIKDDNPLDCLVEKIKIVQLPLNVDLATKVAALSDSNYYYDMMYNVLFSSFLSVQPDSVGDGNESDSTISSEADVGGTISGVKIVHEDVSQLEEHKKVEMMLLDLYSGCGAMSTGLCLGANMSGMNLVTKWAVDMNKYACESLKLNHPETEVRDEKAEDFLTLLKEWERLCVSFLLIGRRDQQQQCADPASVEDDSDDEADDEADEVDEGGEDDPEAFEVEKVLSICYGDPQETGKSGLQLKIRWKGYGPDADTWEPIDGLGDCREKIKEFVTNGYKSKILPLPGDADVICGGPPCQGISGFNRFRNKENPLADPKNKQLVVFMDIVNYLRPRFVLMENVVDIVKFAGGFLGRYALGSLVGMNYQARMGMMVAGGYGLPQFRMRMFMWGAHHEEKLPQYPLPTHNVVVRGNTPTEFESNAVAYDEGREVELEKELFLGDAISDLPPVANDEECDEMPYNSQPETEFQQFIRLRKEEMPGFSASGSEPSQHVLFDHRPLRLNDDDYQRVCHIPMRKGANFRDLKGVRVRDDKKVEWDTNVERVYLPSGKPLVPDYAMTFVGGTSSKPFSRLWWDETVPTVITRAEPHNHTITHPQQNRVLTVRENARLQGFPDYYKLLGPIKERYIQVGNAVAVPVARALGFSLALASKGSCDEEPLFTLPAKFPRIQDRLSPTPTLEEEEDA